LYLDHETRLNDPVRKPPKDPNAELRDVAQKQRKKTTDHLMEVYAGHTNLGIEKYWTYYGPRPGADKYERKLEEYKEAKKALKVVRKCVEVNREDIKKLRDHNNMLNVTVEAEKEVYEKLKSMDMVNEAIWNAKFKTDADPEPDQVTMDIFWNAVSVRGDDRQLMWKHVLHIPQDSTLVKKSDVLGFSEKAVEHVSDASHKIKGGRFERMKMYREKVRALKEGENLRPPVPGVFIELYEHGKELQKDRALFDAYRGLVTTVTNPTFGQPATAAQARVKMMRLIKKIKEKKTRGGVIDAHDMYIIENYKPIDNERWTSFDKWVEARRRDIFKYPGRKEVAYADSPFKRLYEEGKLKRRRQRLEADVAKMPTKPMVKPERDEDGYLLPVPATEVMERLWVNQEDWAYERYNELMRSKEKKPINLGDPVTDVYERMWADQEAWTDQSLQWIDKQRAWKEKVKLLSEPRGFGGEGLRMTDDTSTIAPDSVYQPYDSVYSDISRGLTPRPDPQDFLKMRSGYGGSVDPELAELNRKLDEEIHSIDKRSYKKGGLYNKDKASPKRPDTETLGNVYRDLATRSANSP